MRHLRRRALAGREDAGMKIDRRSLRQHIARFGAGDYEDHPAMALVRTRREALKPRCKLAIECSFAASLRNRIPLLRPAPVERPAISLSASPGRRTGHAIVP